MQKISLSRTCFTAGCLRAGIPHAMIEEIDTSKAKAMKGVACVLTAKDIPGVNRYGIAFQDQYALAEDRVRYVGEPVALVAAETEEIAKDAIKAIRVRYRELPVIMNPHQALAEGAPLIHEKGNLLLHSKIRKGNVELGFSQADVIVENTYRTHVVDHAYMETESGIGRIDEHGNIVIWSANQCPFRDRRQVAGVLGMRENKVRVIRATTGGAFGGKDDITVEIHIGLLVQATKRPVRLVLEREESFLSQTKRHAIEIWTRWGATKDGKLCAMEGKVYGDKGPYAGLGAFVIKKCGIHLSGPYYIPNIKVDSYSVYTNNLFGSAMRGFGVAQAAIAHEAQMDELAKSLADRSPGVQIDECPGRGSFHTHGPDLLRGRRNQGHPSKAGGGPIERSVPAEGSKQGNRDKEKRDRHRFDVLRSGIRLLAAGYRCGHR